MVLSPDEIGTSTFEADHAESQAAFDKAHPNIDKAPKKIAGLAAGTFAAIIAVCIIVAVLVPLITCCILKRQQKTRRKRVDAEMAAAAKLPASLAVPVPTQFPGPVYPQDRQGGPVKGRKAGGQEWQEVPLDGGRV